MEVTSKWTDFLCLFQLLPLLCQVFRQTLTKATAVCRLQIACRVIQRCSAPRTASKWLQHRSQIQSTCRITVALSRIGTPRGQASYWSSLKRLIKKNFQCWLHHWWKSLKICAITTSTKLSTQVRLRTEKNVKKPYQPKNKGFKHPIVSLATRLTSSVTNQKVEKKKARLHTPKIIKVASLN